MYYTPLDIRIRVRCPYCFLQTPKPIHAEYEYIPLTPLLLRSFRTPSQNPLLSFALIQNPTISFLPSIPSPITTYMALLITFPSSPVPYRKCSQAKAPRRLPSAASIATPPAGSVSLDINDGLSSTPYISSMISCISRGWSYPLSTGLRSCPLNHRVCSGAS